MAGPHKLAVEEMREFLKLGQELGYDGEVLQKFVSARVASVEERVGREFEENEKRRKFEENEKRREFEEKEKLRLASEEREERKLKREHDRELAAIQLEVERVKAAAVGSGTAGTGGVSTSATGSNFRMRAPDFPKFDDKRDDLDSYIERFERTAKQQGWPEEEWAFRLSTVLTGEALAVYSEMKTVDAEDFKKLTSALLKHYQLTEEGYRVKLRECRPLQGETAVRLVARLDKYLHRWITLSKIEKTYDGLLDLLMREQFIIACPRMLALFLRERSPASIDEMSRLAEQYLEAHGTSGNGNGFGHQPTGKPERSKPFPPKRNDVTMPVAHPGPHVPNAGNKGQCYNCGSRFHKVRDCKAPRMENRSYFRSPMQKAAVAMPQGQNQRPKAYTPRPSNQCKHVNEASACLARIEETFGRCVENGELQLACGKSLPIITGACDCHRQRSDVVNMPVMEGRIGDKEVKVLRDTGCSSAVVRSDLVSDGQLTGRSQACLLIDGTVREVPIARIHVETPYLTGEVDAMCMKASIYDLIIGNLPGARDPGNPNRNWNDPENDSLGCPDSVSESQSGKSPNLSRCVGQERGAIYCANSESDDVVVDRSGKASESTSAEPKCKDGSCPKDDLAEANAVVTRAQAEQAKKPVVPLKITEPKKGIEGLNSDCLKRDQCEDKGLTKFFQYAKSGEILRRKGQRDCKFQLRKGILFRIRFNRGGDTSKQIVVPLIHRDKVMGLGHETMMTGHLKRRKMTDRVGENFYWPGMSGDIGRFCLSCDICQKTIPKGRVGKVPLQSVPVVSEPFDKVAIDLVGPIRPPSDSGKSYILTMIDYSTRYPDAVALKTIDTETVAEGLIGMFSRLGFPVEILSDQGSQFMSNVMNEVARLIRVKQLSTTPYHPICNGLLEHFHLTLKQMLMKVCVEKPKQWDRYLDAVLFAYREVPQESLGFSPFEMLYGRTVRGPMHILKELWSEEVETPEVRNSYEYVFDLRNRLEETCKLAHEQLTRAQARAKHYYDKSARPRKLEVGDKALILLPTNHNKLLMQWRGPFVVTGTVGINDYRIDLGSAREKVFHINLLKKYTSRVPLQQCSGDTEVAAGIAVIDIDNECDQDGAIDDDGLIDISPLSGKETYKDVSISQSLSPNQREQVTDLLDEFKGIFTDIPGTTDLVEHKIVLSDDKPVHVKPYPMPYTMQDVTKKEIDEMLRLGIIEYSDSAYSAPIVMVKKRDKSYRCCIDYRKLNLITRFDSEPMCNADDILAKLADDKIYSKFDLTKGFWQTKVAEDSRDYTAFVSILGCFRFVKTPFGLKNSGATFNRLMRKLLNGLPNVDNFVDDVLAHTKTWQDHIDTLRQLFIRIRDAGLTVRPTKCFIGFRSLEFVGHRIGEGKVEIEAEKVEKVRNAERPKTKKQLRSFLGLVSWFSSFIKGYADLASPLTELTRKGNPNALVWGNAEQSAFDRLKMALCDKPVLRMPQFDKPFVIQVDASDMAIGAALLQEFNGTLHPVSYASKKLLPRERNFSTIERECLSLVFAVRKFAKYLYGTEFYLHTDHEPLGFIDRMKIQNARVMRWALFLQNYSYRIKFIKGADNKVADFLSRSYN